MLSLVFSITSVPRDQDEAVGLSVAAAAPVPKTSAALQSPPGRAGAVPSQGLTAIQQMLGEKTKINCPSLNQPLLKGSVQRILTGVETRLK
jgi:hypothetical protein